MAELTPTEPPRVPVVLRVLPLVAVVAALIGLVDHPLGAGAALVATGAVMGTTLLRLGLQARSWAWATDARYLLATVALLLVIIAGSLLGLRG